MPDKLGIIEFLMLIMTICNLLIFLKLTYPNIFTMRKVSPDEHGSAQGSYEDELLTEQEKQRVQWNSDFDERIRLMKDELAEQHGATHVTIPAEEMHPDVHNIPHDAVDTRQSRRYDEHYVEVAE
jgi:hypothetical protein